MMHRRTVERVLTERLAEATVVRVSGPRAAGKTTSAVTEIERRGGSIVRLDDPDERAAVAADPSGYLSGLTHPVLLDEYQRVPTTLDVIKVDLSRRGEEPGRWLITGSISIDAVKGAADSLGGRITDVVMGTLSVDERNDLPEPAFLSTILSAGGPANLRGWRASSQMTRDRLIAEAIRGGFPLVTDQPSQAARRRRLNDWVDASVVADGAAVAGVRNVEDLRRMLRLYACATASITPKDRPTADRLEISRQTVARYRDLLAGLHVTWDLPAFRPGNATGQVTRSPKLHLIDSGLAASLAGRDLPESANRDPQFTGALIETMVANDLQVQASAHPLMPRLFHFREDSREVDLVVEGADGRVVGIEVKLTSQPGERDLAGLRRLRTSSKSRWAGGMVLCRVPAARLTEDELVIAPIESVWQLTG